MKRKFDELRFTNPKNSSTFAHYFLPIFPMTLESQRSADQQDVMAILARMGNDNLKTAITRVGNACLKILDEVSDRELTDAEKKIQRVMRSEIAAVSRI